MKLVSRSTLITNNKFYIITTVQMDDGVYQTRLRYKGNEAVLYETVSQSLSCHGKVFNDVLDGTIEV